MSQNTAKHALSPAAPRLAALRARLKEMSLTGFLVPHADEHQSEYLPPSAERLAWLTGFTGSAGFAIVTADRAAIFTDGRYTLQVRAETDASLFAYEDLVSMPPARWLAKEGKPDWRIGYDPWLLSLAERRRFAEAAERAGVVLVAVTGNPVDAIWADRPAPPLGSVFLQPVELAGESAESKLARIAASLGEARADATVIAAADSIAWLFNIRGRDIAHNPVALAYAVLPREGKPTLHIDGRKLSNEVRSALADLADIAEPAALSDSLAQLGAGARRVLLAPAATAAAIADMLQKAGAECIDGADPVALPKSTKNAVELAGARRAQIRDGVAMTRFLAFLAAEGPTGRLDEIGAAERLAAERRRAAEEDGVELVDLSFDTISGAGPNGAIVHYRVSPATNRPIETGSLYLIDSGGQYPDGTTDITRTVAIGVPNDEMRRRFTLVLKGHIALARARFPVGTQGAQLDTLARMALWAAGLDYDHGTGHGVGSFLSVHEGPARIAKTGYQALEPGMILSNEPGFYRTGAYGIRIENLIVVTPPAPVTDGERPMLGFETLTLAPIDLALVDAGLLDGAERTWLDAYHARVRAELLPRLAGADRDFLIAATRPVSE